MENHRSKTGIPAPDHPLLSLIEHYAVEEGITQTKWPGLVFGRSNRPIPRYPLEYMPSICVVAQGRKEVFMGNECIIYDPFHYLVVGLPIPLEAEILEASPQQPFLALALEIDMSFLGKLLLEIEEKNHPLHKRQVDGQAVYSCPIDKELLKAFVRFLRLLETPDDLNILGPGIVKEILYNVLKGGQGSFLRDLPFRNSESQRVATVVRYIQENYTQSHNISSIAGFAGMAKSTLHHAFEKTVGQSPIQYLKKIRLHNARKLIVINGQSASEAAYNVGYSSASQFSREYKRQFGLPPSQTAEHVMDLNS